MMTAQEIYKKVMLGLKQLEQAGSLLSISEKFSISNVLVDPAAEKIICSRDGKKVTVGFDHIKTACADLSSGKPSSLDSFVTVNLKTRGLIETLFAYLPNVGFLPANKLPNKRGKKLIWFDEEVHPVGEMFDACDYLLARGNVSAAGADIGDIAAAFCDEARENAKLNISQPFATRLCAALLSKRFLILTGLSGSGKTKIAQALAQWLTPDTEDSAADDADNAANPHFALIPVGADWVGNENILGYPNGLEPASYVTRQALDLIIHANDHPTVPHFLILDEMNLSHVERYFADILSAIESGDEISLYEGAPRSAGGRTIPNRIRLPGNLFIIGTVNVDETTYMFSPKVLDRANVIEFRMAQQDIAVFLQAPGAPDLDALQGQGAQFAESFVAAASDKASDLPANVKAQFAAEMMLLFETLREHNLEFGYRTANEAARFVRYFQQLGGYAEDDASWFATAMDAVIIQKILPRLHGSRSKLEGLLRALAWFCAASRDGLDEQAFKLQLQAANQAEDDAKYGPEQLWQQLQKRDEADPASRACYPMSFTKVWRMWQRLVRDQFVTFTES